MKVLVIDDAAVVRTRVASRLGEIAGVEAVLEAAGGDEALRLAERERPRVVVLDLHLDGETGLALLPRFKAENGTVVVVLTNDASEHHRRVCFALGADHFFDKSRELDRVADVVEAITSDGDRARPRG